MKVSRIGFVALLLSASLLFPNENFGLHSLVQANAVRESKTGLPFWNKVKLTISLSPLVWVMTIHRLRHQLSLPEK